MRYTIGTEPSLSANGVRIVAWWSVRPAVRRGLVGSGRGLGWCAVRAGLWTVVVGEAGGERWHGRVGVLGGRRSGLSWKGPVQVSRVESAGSGWSPGGGHALALALAQASYLSAAERPTSDPMLDGCNTATSDECRTE